MFDPAFAHVVWTRAKERFAEDALALKPFISALPKTHKFLPLPATRQESVIVSVPKDQQASRKSTSYGIITSLAAADEISRQGDLKGWAQGTQTVFTHSERAAAALRKLGLKVTLLNFRTAQELTEAILREAVPEGSQMVYVGAEFPAFPIAETLRNRGRHCQHWACYRTITELCTIQGSPLERQELDYLGKNLRGILCLFSPSSAMGFAQVVAQHPELADQLDAVCIGPTTAEVARHSFKKLHIAPGNSREDCLKVCAQILNIKLP
jgi:uroporphyrinogen-III synthase